MHDRDFWNERFSGETYLYGTEPNAFLVENADMLAGPVLSISEGEGRNAVFLASRGLEVLGVDSSDVGLGKAQALARARGVRIETEIADLADYVPQEDHFGSVVSISAHLPSAIRTRLYPLLEKALKPGGILLLEAYTPDQLEKGTGGPKNLDMLMSLGKLEREFPHLTPVVAREIEREVHEGAGHTGMACVVQFIARKEA